MKMIKVFFDGACGYCSKEIRYYKKISNKEVFRWVNVAAEPNALADYNISQAQALLHLHAIDNNNNIYVGADAFAVIWKNLPVWHVLGHFISFPIINSIASILYTWFAKRRFNKYEHCLLASTTVPKKRS